MPHIDGLATLEWSLRESMLEGRFSPSSAKISIASSWSGSASRMTSTLSYRYSERSSLSDFCRSPSDLIIPHLMTARSSDRPATRPTVRAAGQERFSPPSRLLNSPLHRTLYFLPWQALCLVVTEAMVSSSGARVLNRKFDMIEP